MPTAIKLGIDCVLVTGLTFAGTIVFVSLPEFSLEPLQWAGRHFDRPIATAFWFVYTVLVWAAVAGIIAWCMLYLKPRNVVLYGLVSAAKFIVTGHSWSLATHAIGYVRELVLMLSIQLLYWAIVHLAARDTTSH